MLVTRGQTTKDQLCDAALALFIEKGIRGTTTREIAQRAGIAEGTIYRHFASKGDLALSLFVRHLDRLLSHLRASIEPERKAEEKLRACIRAMFDFARTNPVSYNYVMHTHPSELEKLSHEKVKPKDVFVEIIREGVRQRKFRKIDEHLAAAMVIGMTLRTIFFYKARMIPLDVGVILRELEESALRVLRPG